MNFISIINNTELAFSEKGVRVTDQYVNIKGSVLMARFKELPVGEEDGSHFLRTKLKTLDNNQCMSRAESNTESLASIVIIDCNNGINKDGVQIEGAPEPRLVHEALKKLNIGHIIYGSYFHYSGHKGNSYRIILTTQKPYPKEQLAATVEAVVFLINQTLNDKLLDYAKENSVFAQTWYIPRQPHNSTISPLYFEYLNGNAVAVCEQETLPPTSDILPESNHSGETRKDKTKRPSMNYDVIEDIEPWPVAINPNELLMEIENLIRRCIVCNSDTVIAAALWTAMTWFIDIIQVAPLAVITAPEKRCGKSQLLFLLARLVKNPLPASNITSAALFRAINEWSPTLLIDEADSFMKDNEELRGILNCGHTRDSAFIIRTVAVGKDHQPRKFNVWGAKALAGIGHLPETLMDRAITLELRRKLPYEKVERLRHVNPDLFASLKSKLSRFAIDYSDTIYSARPQLPEILNDRAQDNWEPLLALADAAGGKWPDLARKAAVNIYKLDNSSTSIGAELLLNIKELFELRKIKRIGTSDLIHGLCLDEEQRWSTYHHGEPITSRQLANLLKLYGIHSKGIRIKNSTPKGFEKCQFTEAFNRYLNPIDPEKSATVQQTNPSANCSVSHPISVAETPNLSATRKPMTDLNCCGVADVAEDMVKVVL